MDQFKAKFKEEALDLLAALEKVLLKLEKDYFNTSVIEETFRVMHTLKGNSAMFGFEHIEEFTHHLETIYDNVRQGKQSVNQEILDVSLAAVDHIQSLLDDEQLRNPSNLTKHRNLLVQVGTINQTSPAPIANADSDSDEGNGTAVKTYFIRFKPEEWLLKNGANPLYLIDELYALGKCKAFPHFRKVKDLQSLDAEACYVSWEILLATTAEVGDIYDVFLFVEDEAEIEVTQIAGTDLFEEEGFEFAIESIKAAEEPMSAAQVREFLLPKQPDTVPEVQKQTPKEQQITSIRVASDKLDNLMNLVSELVTTQARFSMFVEQHPNSELTSIAEEVEKISRRLRDNTFSICLIPIEHLFMRFQRLVRDLSKELKKDILLFTEGDETELDKSIIESLTDPILHILRNSIDHGIEPADVRLASNKPKQGKITLKAFYSGTYVNISISDDGAGIDAEKVKAKAISKGLVPEDASLSEAEIYELLFLPGFSTASQVTEVSGRGVGMDVVKRKISDIRGEIHIDSKLGKGTNITIKLPLTLSVIDGFLVKIGNTHYVIPLAVVERCYEIKREQLANHMYESITLEDELVPFIDLKEKLGHLTEASEQTDQNPQYEHIITVLYNEKKVGLVVDSIVGEYQAVLKPLGKLYKHQDTMSGATILGDGTIALVMDTNKLAYKFLSQSINQKV